MPTIVQRECKVHGLTDFYVFKRKEGNYRYTCKKCSIENEKRKRKNKKIKAVEYLGGKCHICGYNKCYNALTFHHKDGKYKESMISRMYNKKWSTIKEELDKCLLVCQNCHRDIHAKEEENYDKVTKHRRKRKRLLFRLHGSKCFICGNNNINNISFHHIGNKNFIISSTQSLEKHIEESKKCIMLCENCHREYHSGLFHQNITISTTFNDKIYEDFMKEQNKEKRYCTYCGKEISNRHNKYFCSTKCSGLNKRVERPSKQELLELSSYNSISAIGRMYNVSQNAVKKWMKNYEIYDHIKGNK